MSVGHAAVWAMAGQYVSFAIMFATSVVISRFFLGPDEVGLFSIALSAGLLLAVVQDFGLTRYVTGLPVFDAREQRRCTSVALVFSFVVAGIICAAAYPLAWFYGMPDIGPLLIIIGASYFFIPFNVVPMALMGRVMRFSGHFSVNVGAALTHAATGLVLAYLGFSAYSLAWATLAAAIAKGLIAQGLQPALPFPLRFDRLKPIIGFGSKTSSLYVVNALGTRTPDMIVGRILEVFSVGLFSRATSLAEQFRMLIAGAIGSVFYPTFARLRDEGEPLGPAYLRVCAGYSVLVLPGLAALSLAAEPLVMILYGPQWIGTAPLLSLIAIQAAMVSCLPLVTDIPILLGKINRLIVLGVLETLAAVSLLIAGSLMAGAEGAAASRIAYAFAFFLVYMRFMMVTLGFTLAGWLAIMAKSLVVTAATIAPLAAAYAFWVPPDKMDFGQLLACSLAGAAMWLVTVFAIRHPALPDMIGTARPLLARVLPARLIAALP